MAFCTPLTRDPVEQSIPARFESQVLQHPHRLAVKTRSEALTYDELNQAANRVAHVILDRLGDGEEPVALLARGVPMVTAILGVLKAGKIYVPLDTYFPQARLLTMVKDAGASLLVTTGASLDLARHLSNDEEQILNLDGLDNQLASENLDRLWPPDRLATLLYTSGSTGQPKGVLQTHRNVLQFIANYTHAIEITESDRLTMLFSYGVIGAVRDLFSALLNGASIHPFNIREEGIEPLSSWIQQEQLTIYNSVTTVFRQFVERLSQDQAVSLPTLRMVRVGGEMVTRHDVDAYKRHFPSHCRLLLDLTATETGTISRCIIDKDTPLPEVVAPVGYPLDDVHLALLDEKGTPVRENEKGEIVVTSRYLSPGYWRRPDLTQAAFIPSSVQAAEVCYHTGDMGKRLADGCLVHLGRKDAQVKIRGFRVEVVEIETVLQDHPDIADAVVLPIDDLDSGLRLAAYFIPRRQPGPVSSLLTTFVRTRLPDYMVPSAFIALDAFPLTVSGKVDRRALPLPGSCRPELDTPFVSPRTPIEQTLATLWAELLGLDRVGVHDLFLNLGGHSIIAMQLIARVHQLFQVEIPLRDLLEAATVEAMAITITLYLLDEDSAETLPGTA